MESTTVTNWHGSVDSGGSLVDSGGSEGIQDGVQFTFRIHELRRKLQASLLDVMWPKANLHFVGLLSTNIQHCTTAGTSWKHSLKNSWSRLSCFFA
eukprot:3706024-Amphidinium_carterae.3